MAYKIWPATFGNGVRIGITGLNIPVKRRYEEGGDTFLPESLHVGCRASGIMSFRSYVTGFRCVLRVPKLDPSAQFEGNFTTTDSSVR